MFHLELLLILATLKAVISQNDLDFRMDRRLPTGKFHLIRN